MQNFKCDNYKCKAFFLHICLRYLEFAYFTWGPSKIKWGTRLKDMKAQDDVFYQLQSGAWGSIKKDFGITRADIEKLDNSIYKKAAIPLT